jgi:translation elongation factor EF-4
MAQGLSARSRRAFSSSRSAVRRRQTPRYTDYEPVVKTTIIAPSEFIGTIMELCQSRRGELGGMDCLSPERVELRYTMPLGEVIF